MTYNFEEHRKRFDAWTKTLDDTLYYLDWMAEKLRSNARSAEGEEGEAEFYLDHEFEVRQLIETLGPEVAARKRT
jgi:hypothetical protein